MSNKKYKISELGKEILQGIKNQHITKTNLALQMEITRATLYNWISGDTAPDHNELTKLYKILNIGAQNASFRHQIFEGDYIGMHKRAWDQFEETLKTALATVVDLRTTNGKLADTNSELAKNIAEVGMTLAKFAIRDQK